MDAPTQCWSRGRTITSGAHVVHPLRTRCRSLFAFPGAVLFGLIAAVLASIADPQGWNGEAHF